MSINFTAIGNRETETLFAGTENQQPTLDDPVLELECASRKLFQAFCYL